MRLLMTRRNNFIFFAVFTLLNLLVQFFLEQNLSQCSALVYIFGKDYIKALLIQVEYNSELVPSAVEGELKLE